MAIHIKVVSTKMSKLAFSVASKQHQNWY